MTTNTDTDVRRRRWMSILAKARDEELTQLWAEHGAAPAFERVRGPETGLVMVRGRAGGTGAPFNLGEMTVTRCTVRLTEGAVGHAYVAGRRERHAELAAVIDALMQNEAEAETLERAVIGPLEDLAQARRDAASRKAAATKVDFFTMARSRPQT